MTPAVIAYRGLPGCGKTTLAAATVAQARACGRRAARVSRDDIRRALSIIPGQGTAADEHEVSRTQLLIIAALVADGVEMVIVDDTNLLDEHLSQLTALANGHGWDFEVRDLREVPLEVCIQRDALRPGTARVGQARILEMATEAGLISTAETHPCLSSAP